MSGEPRLSVRGLGVRYGGVRALTDVDLDLAAGELVGLIGPNGAGKTTAIDAMCGFVPHEGTVRLGGTDLSSSSPHRRARAGLARTWQSVELFDDLTVGQHCQVSAQRVGFRDLVLDVFAPARTSRDDAAVHRALDLLGIGHLVDALPAALPHGTRKLVGVARALAGSPEVLLLDEPAAGLDSSESTELGSHLRRLADEGLSMLLIDHDTQLVMGVCDRVLVLDFGSLIAAGTPEQIRSEPAVVEAYLGVGGGRDAPAEREGGTTP